MVFDQLIKSENSNDRYISWEQYRNHLTEKIVNNINDILIKKRIKEEKIRRVKNKRQIDLVTEENGNKPTLAIWGAGGCNDIDIADLASYFTIVLIDDNEQIIREAKERAMLTDEQCICTNLRFWDVWEEEYTLFDALIKDRANIEDIKRYFMDIECKMDSMDYDSLPRFDFSVCVGLASQLNSRFVAILLSHQYEDLFYGKEEVKEITGIIEKLNSTAVDRLFSCMNKLTKYGMFIGYEYDAYYNDEFDGRLVDEFNELESMFEESAHIFNTPEEHRIWDIEIKVQGSVQLNELLKRYIKEAREPRMSLHNNETLIWQFLDDKCYIMIFRTIDKL